MDITLFIKTNLFKEIQHTPKQQLVLERIKNDTPFLIAHIAAIVIPIFLFALLFVIQRKLIFIIPLVLLCIPSLFIFSFACSSLYKFQQTNTPDKIEINNNGFFLYKNEEETQVISTTNLLAFHVIINHQYHFYFNNSAAMPLAINIAEAPDKELILHQTIAIINYKIAKELFTGSGLAFKLINASKKELTTPDKNKLNYLNATFSDSQIIVNSAIANKGKGVAYEPLKLIINNSKQQLLLFEGTEEKAPIPFSEIKKAAVVFSNNSSRYSIPTSEAVLILNEEKNLVIVRILQAMQNTSWQHEFMEMEIAEDMFLIKEYLDKIIEKNTAVIK